MSNEEIEGYDVVEVDGEFIVTPDHLDTIEEPVDANTRIRKLAEEGVFRRGIIAVLQEDSIKFGLGKEMEAVLDYGRDYIESWKYNGDTTKLNASFTVSESTRLRAALDKKTTTNTTIQQYIIATVTKLDKG